jgi:hypothetical protein
VERVIERGLNPEGLLHEVHQVLHGRSGGDGHRVWAESPVPFPAVEFERAELKDLVIAQAVPRDDVGQQRIGGELGAVEVDCLVPQNVQVGDLRIRFAVGIRFSRGDLVSQVNWLASVATLR